MKTSRGLTHKQEAFVREYLIDLNGAAAVRRAGYKIKNADDLAVQLLRKTLVQSAIQEAIAKRSEKTAITAENVLHRLWEEANLQGEGATHAARIRALELVGRHTGLKFTEQHELSGPNGGPIETADAAREKLLGKLPG